MKILMRNAVRPIQRAIVIVAILAVMVGSNSLGARAQDAVQGNLTTLSDSEIVAYRWQAMGRYYAAVPTPVNLTTLSDGEIIAYRWQAMGRYYTDGTAHIVLPTSTADVLRGVAAAQPSLGAAMVTVNSEFRSGQYAAPAQRTGPQAGSRPVADVLGMARTAFGSLSTLADSIVAVFRLPQ